MHPPRLTKLWRHEGNINRPLVPEYTCIQTFDGDTDPLGDFKLLETLTQTGDDKRVRSGKPSRRLGIYHTKKEFFDKAVKCRHPCNSFDAVKGRSWLSRNNASKRPCPNIVEKCCNPRPSYGRRNFWVRQASKIRQSWTLGACGTPLVGSHSKSEIFGEKIVLAKTSEELLRAASVWRNPTSVARLAHDDDPSMQDILWQETMGEVEKGFISGPYETLEEVKASLGATTVCVVRRFAILQGAGSELKPRIIDDAKESGLNAAYTCKDKLDLHDSGHISSLASYIGALKEEAERKGGCCDIDGESTWLHKEMIENPRWSGRCLDLTKSYKQIPVSSESRSLMILMVPKPGTGKQVFFTIASMHFGCAASVFSFNRITRSLLHLMQILLGDIGGVFYDDFALLEPSISSRILLETLGWKFAKEGDKATSFDSCFNLLGAQLDLSCLHLGRLMVANKPGRLEKMKALLLEIKSRGRISKAEAQTLQGLLNYASGFFLGSSCRMATRCFSNLKSDLRRAKMSEVTVLCDFTIACPEKASARAWACAIHDSCIVVFTDGSFEKGVGLWGAVVIDDAVGQTAEISGWSKLAGDQVISQIEAFAAVLIRCFSERTGLEGKRFSSKIMMPLVLPWSRRPVVRRAYSGSISCPRLFLPAHVMGGTNSFCFEHRWLAITWFARQSSWVDIRPFVWPHSPWSRASERFDRSRNVTSVFASLSLTYGKGNIGWGHLSSGFENHPRPFKQWLPNTTKQARKRGAFTLSDFSISDVLR